MLLLAILSQFQQMLNLLAIPALRSLAASDAPFATPGSWDDNISYTVSVKSNFPCLPVLANLSVDDVIGKSAARSFDGMLCVCVVEQFTNAPEYGKSDYPLGYAALWDDGMWHMVSDGYCDNYYMHAHLCQRKMFGYDPPAVGM